MVKAKTRDLRGYGTSERRYGEEWASPPYASLTKAGLALLTEIWELQGRPFAYEGEYGNELVDITKIPMRNAKPTRHTFGRVREHAMPGGYIDFIDGCTVEEAMAGAGMDYLLIAAIGLSKRGFAALIEAGVITPEVIHVSHDRGKAPHDRKAHMARRSR